MNTFATPETVVQCQLDAYNARDIDALMALYAADAQAFEHPATLLASGAAMLRERFLSRFLEPNLHATLIQRIVMGNIVMDYEQVARTFPDGPGKVEFIMTYEVQHGKISRVWGLQGPKTLD
jgi:hypothetical protein